MDSILIGRRCRKGRRTDEGQLGDLQSCPCRLKSNRMTWGQRSAKEKRGQWEGRQSITKGCNNTLGVLLRFGSDNNYFILILKQYLESSRHFHTAFFFLACYLRQSCLPIQPERFSACVLDLHIIFLIFPAHFPNLFI